MGTKERTKMNEKEELVVGEIDAGWSPISLVPVNTGIVATPESHDNARTVPIPESHVDVGTIPILESHVDTGTVHTYASMPTEVQTPQKSDSPTVPLWML